MSYPQQPPQYPPAQPQAYPVAPQPPAPPYSPPQPQGYPVALQPSYSPPQPQPPYTAPAPQGYPQPPQYGQPAAPPPVPGTLSDFYAQPSTGGGKSLSFETPGTSYTGIVTRPITDADIEQQTNPKSGAPAFFKDGRPKFVMRVPLQIQPCPAYPDGLAQWYCKGSARDDLVRAMAEAGAPEGPPEAGSVITITMTSTRPSGPGLSPTKLFAVQYRRPMGVQSNGQAPAPAAVTDTPVPSAPPAYQPAPPPVYATNGAAPPPVYATNGAAPMPADPVPPPPAPGPAADLTPEQQALLAQLVSQQTQPTH